MGKYWGKTKIRVVLALQCCFSMSKTYNPNNDGGSVYELTRPVWTLVPFPELCLHSLLWNAHLQTQTLAIVYLTWCILVSLGSNNFIGYGINLHPIHLRVTVTRGHTECYFVVWSSSLEDVLPLSRPTAWRLRTLQFYLLCQPHFMMKQLNIPILLK